MKEKGGADNYTEKSNQGFGDGLHVETGENPSGCQASVSGQMGDSEAMV